MFNNAIKKNIPYLYHYQPFNKEYIADLVLNNRIKLSNPTGFNDPWDCRIIFSKQLLDNPEIYKANVEYAIDVQRRHLQISESELAIRREELMNNLDLMRATMDEYTQGMNDAIDKDYRVYCLSSEPDNFLMWAHYANHHKGLCFGFKSTSKVFSEALEVTYSELYPQLDPSENNENKFFRDALLTKAKAWSYENEFRLIAKESESESFFTLQNGYLSFNPEDLASVIVGCSTLEEDILILKEILKDRESPIELFRVLPSSDRYSLVIQDL